MSYRNASQKHPDTEVSTAEVHGDFCAEMMRESERSPSVLD